MRIGITCAYDVGMETNTNTTSTKYAWFENTDKDQFEIHAPNCACIKKYINQMVIDTSSVHSMNAANTTEVQAELIAVYGYDLEDDEQITVKVFPCTK